MLLRKSKEVWEKTVQDHLGEGCEEKDSHSPRPPEPQASDGSRVEQSVHDIENLPTDRGIRPWSSAKAGNICIMHEGSKSVENRENSQGNAQPPAPVLNIEPADNLVYGYSFLTHIRRSVW